MNELLKQAKNVANEIKESAEYRQYLKLESIILKKYQQELALFNKTKQEYDEVLKYGKNHPDFNEKQSAYQKAKKSLYEMPLVKEYKELENEIQNELNKLAREIGGLVSKNIAVPNEIGIIERIKKHG